MKMRERVCDNFSHYYDKNPINILESEKASGAETEK